jgi:hypothetical protein
MLQWYGACHPGRALLLPAVPIGVTRKGDAIPGDRRQRGESLGRPEDRKQCRLRNVETGNSSGWSKVGNGRREPEDPAVGKAQAGTIDRRKGCKPRTPAATEMRINAAVGRRTSINKAGVEGPRPEPGSRVPRTGRSWKGLEISAVSRKRSSDTSTRRGGASLLSFFVPRKWPRTIRPANRHTRFRSGARRRADCLFTRFILQ